MRKFKFVGPSNKYLKHGSVYEGNFRPPYFVSTIGKLATDFPSQYEEVTEPTQTRIPNQDMPASSMTKLEMAVLGNVKGIISTLVGVDDIYPDRIVSDAIDLAKETFKQLDQIK